MEWMYHDETEKCQPNYDKKYGNGYVHCIGKPIDAKMVMSFFTLES